MSRVPYVPEDLAEPKDIVEAVRARRGGVLRNLDRLLLHSPELTRGWNTYLSAVRNRLDLDPRVRELAICAVAVVNEAEYEFFHHAPELLKAGGNTAQLDALRDVDAALSDSRHFDERERAVLALTVEMTRNVKVSDATFARARRHLGAVQPLIELIATIATYNMVSRFLVALEVEH